MIVLTAAPCPRAPPGWWEVSRPDRRDTVICRAATAADAATTAAGEWSLSPDAYTLNTITTTESTT